jgi:hypothetical protein
LKSIGLHIRRDVHDLLSRSRERIKVRRNLRPCSVFANRDATTPNTIERFPHPACGHLLPQAGEGFQPRQFKLSHCPQFPPLLLSSEACSAALFPPCQSQSKAAEQAPLQRQQRHSVVHSQLAATQLLELIAEYRILGQTRKTDARLF